MPSNKDYYGYIFMKIASPGEIAERKMGKGNVCV
jgi:hypothetical protein